MPIHRHKGTSETCVCVRGHLEEYFYDAEGHLTETVDMVPGGVVLNIEAGQWHSLKCLESGTVLLEAKDGAWRELGVEEVMEIPDQVRNEYIAGASVPFFLCENLWQNLHVMELLVNFATQEELPCLEKH